MSVFFFFGPLSSVLLPTGRKMSSIFENICACKKAQSWSVTFEKSEVEKITRLVLCNTFVDVLNSKHTQSFLPKKSMYI